MSGSGTGGDRADGPPARGRSRPRPSSRTGGIPELGEILGARELDAVRALGAADLGHLLRIPPNRYLVPGRLTFLGDMHQGEEISSIATVLSVHERPMNNRKGSVVTATVDDGTAHLPITFFARHGGAAQWYRRRLPVGGRVHISGTVGSYRGEPQIVHPEVVPLDGEHTLDEAMRPVPIYPLRGQVTQKLMRQAFATALSYAPLLPDVLPPEVLAENDLPSLIEALAGIHSPFTPEEARRGRRHLAFEEAFVLQTIFAQRRAADDLTSAPALRATGPLQEQLRERLPFTLTGGQVRIGEQIARRIEQDRPTSVLLQGDVGSGKTVVALLAMLRAVDSGCQAALLAPTEVLAEQHHRTIMELLGEHGRGGRIDGSSIATRVRLLTGSQRVADRRRTLLDVTSGEAGIVIGTHALLTETVEFAGLGLVVIDEQHRFGVDHRRALRSRGPHGRTPHMIVMTATPIPRSAALAMVGDLDVLTLDESPVRRAGLTSFTVPEGQTAWRDRMWSRVREEIDAGRQAFVVCPRINDEPPRVDDGRIIIAETPGDPPRGVEETAQRLREDPRLKGVRIGTLHGRMSTEEKQAAMAAMVAGEVDLLVATTVIEVGVDVPNATAMVVLDAERFGVSQLHQLRGRVGRGEHPGIVFFDTTLPAGSDGAEHLEQIASTQDGFALASLDLERRGVGDLVGTRQSGMRRTLRHLDVLHDEEVLLAARRAADALIAVDPDLDAHRGLAEAVDARLADADPDVERS